MQRILIHIKTNSFVKYVPWSQSMERTRWPVSGTTIVTGSYLYCPVVNKHWYYITGCTSILAASFWSCSRAHYGVLLGLLKDCLRSRLYIYDWEITYRFLWNHHWAYIISVLVVTPYIQGGNDLVSDFKNNNSIQSQQNRWTRRRF